MPVEFSRDPISYIEDREHATQLLSAYLTPGLFSGSLWDPAIRRRLGPGERDIIDVEDLYSPTLLSAPIRRSSGQAIIEQDAEISRLLRAVDHDVPLWDPREAEVTAALDAACSLVEELKRVRYVGPTRASKLAAAKRPELVPIWDSQISQALGADRMSWPQYWTAWRQAILPTVEELRSIADEAGHPQLSPLRTIDIIIWMERWGWQDLPVGQWGKLRAACNARRTAWK